MARMKDPEYVVNGRKGYEVQIGITHPLRCGCVPCQNPRNHRTNEDGELIIRTRRKSRYPKSYPQSVSYALKLKEQLEAELREAVAAADAREEALGSAVSVGAICDHYEAWQREHGKDWDRDRYRVAVIRDFLGATRDATTVTYNDYLKFCVYLKTRERNTKNGSGSESKKTAKNEKKTGCSKSTARRYVNTLLAIFNRAVKARLIPSHQLTNIERPKVVTNKKPVIFTNRQVAVLLGSAMDRYEQEQADAHRDFDADTKRKKPSVVPLRRFCEIAYTTLMRPETIFDLRWEQLILDPARDRGRFRLDHHKNASKGVEVEAPVKPDLVRYLKSIMPSKKPSGLVHPNPETGLAFVNIRKQWQQLVNIANEILGPDEQLTGARTHFYTWRHSGASSLAASSKDPVLVTRMMGDTQLQTVMRHYFDSDYEHMQLEVERWQMPTEQAPTARIESAIESDPN